MSLMTDTPQNPLPTDVSVSLRKLILIRWVAVLGQAVTVLVVHFGFGFELPLTSAFVVIGASVALNLMASRKRSGGARLGDREAAAYLAYDTLQLGSLLFLTGGLQNPFAILMLAPVTVSATILSRSSVISLSALTVIAISALARWHLPLPQRGDLPLDPRPVYVLGFWTALVCSTLFIAGYAWSIAVEARKMRDAYAATQLALAREQRISAVGGLAAAAAHQLGSPLATITVIAKELARDLPPDSPHAADAELLLSQSERCRTILADLVHHRDGEHGSPFARLPFSALVEAAGEPHLAPEIAVQYEVEASRGPDGRPLEEPLVARSPEIMHGVGNLIQNAIHFAQGEVEVTTSWTADKVAVDIADDGPGFSDSVLARIGEPYISARGSSGPPYATQHMGLGIFIAQTLLARTGARLTFDNLSDGGAHVAIEWRRQHLDATEPGLFLREAGE
ncbi:MAG TPA: ActS/PrrB/RegB family redox-sensitive histidine kinase [Stellaceae bacterium]|nr:ActS/PrrB/RegB family redox-sensitive histidine kinase [Stellaceae bacterium]